MLEIREDQIEALRAAVRRGFPETLLANLQAQNIDAKRDTATGSVVARDKNGTTSLSFTPDSAPDTLTLPSGEQYRFQTDRAGRLKALDHSGGGRLELDHDPLGRLTALRRPGIDEHGFSYDEAGRISAVRYPDGGSQRFELDKEGNLIGLHDRSGAYTEYQRDTSGNLLLTRDPLGRETRYSYAGGGLDRIDYPDGSHESFGFDVERNAGVITRRDGSDVYHGLNGAGALSEIIWPDGSYNEYDVVDGVLQGAYSESSWIDFEIDPGGHPVKEKTPGGVVQVAYDHDGRLERLMTPHGDVVKYRYDGDGRLAGIVDWDGKSQSFKYGDDGTLQAIRYGNGLVEKQHYAGIGRLATATVIDEHKRVVSEQRYEYDPCGRLTTLQDLDPREGWQRRIAVDIEGRPTSVVDENGNVVERLEYDLKGNIVRDGTAQVVVGPMDEIVRHGDSALAYDGLGNITKMPSAKGVLHHSYLANGMLGETRIAEGGAERTIRYEYDPLGRRIGKTDGVQTWRYGYFGHQLLWEDFHEAPGARAVRRDYLWCPDSVVPVAFREGGRTYWIQCDTRGAPIRVFKKDGTTVWRARYDAFGKAHIDIELVRMPFRLSGQYHDDETGLHHTLCRYHCPQLKTFLSRDPLWHRVGATNYSYCYNRPYDYADPFGSLPFLLAAVAAVAVGAVVGAVVGGITAAISGEPILGAMASGAIEGGAMVAGAIIGGLIGGPVGVVVGGMVGSTVGTFVGTLAEQAINGDPICLRCAANAAAQALLIDIALLGLGKIPGVKRAVRKLGIYLLKKSEPIRKWAKKQISKVNPKVPRKWADKQAGKAPKASPEQAAKESADYAARQKAIQENFDNYDNLPDAMKPKGRDGKPLSKERVGLAYKGDPARGGERLPLTFKDWDEYDAFKKDLGDALKRGGVDDATVQQVGSGTKGWAGNPKKTINVDGKDVPKPWSPESDTDFAIFSNKGTAQAYAQNTPANTKIVQGDKYTVFKNGATRDRGFGQTDVGKELDALSKKWNKQIYGKENVDGFDFKLNTTDQPFGSGPITTLKQ